MKLLTLLVIIACILIIKTTAHWDDCDEDVNDWEHNDTKESVVEDYDWDEDHDRDDDDDWDPSNSWDGDDDDCEEHDDDWDSDDDDWDDNNDDCEEDNDDGDHDHANKDGDQEGSEKSGNNGKKDWGSETFHIGPTKPSSIETWPVSTYGLPSSSSPLPGVPFTVTATSTQLFTVTGLPPLPQSDHIASMSRYGLLFRKIFV